MEIKTVEFGACKLSLFNNILLDIIKYPFKETLMVASFNLKAKLLSNKTSAAKTSSYSIYTEVYLYLL